jgi:tRNA dimethylallyltransferase
VTSKRRWLAIAGPTGSGKSALALAAAAALDGEIIGCDSVQLYRGFDIGAAKPTAAERASVPHHLVDCLDWHEDCDAARYALLAREALAAVQARGRLPIVVGGTGLYLRALVADAFHDDLPKDEALRGELRAEAAERSYARLVRLDPARAAELHPNDRFRVIRALELCLLLGRPVSEVFEAAGGERRTELGEACHLVVLEPPRRALHAAIAARTRQMLEQGLLAEVRGLLEAGVDAACKPMQSIGYKQALAHLRGALPATDLAAAIDAATRQYAKRQCTWFRKVAADVRLESWELAQVVAVLRSRFPGAGAS